MGSAPTEHGLVVKEPDLAEKYRLAFFRSVGKKNRNAVQRQQQQQQQQEQHQQQQQQQQR